MSLTTPAARRDQSFHLHPSTNLRALQNEGPLVITRGEGVYVYDDEGRRYLEGMAGLWLIITEAEIDEMMRGFESALDETWAMVREKGLA